MNLEHELNYKERDNKRYNYELRTDFYFTRHGPRTSDTKFTLACT